MLNQFCHFTLKSKKIWKIISSRLCVTRLPDWKVNVNALWKYYRMQHSRNSFEWRHWMWQMESLAKWLRKTVHLTTDGILRLLFNWKCFQSRTLVNEKSEWMNSVEYSIICKHTNLTTLFEENNVLSYQWRFQQHSPAD